MYFFIVYIATSLIRLLQFLLFARAIISWFPSLRGGTLSDFLYTVTEPIIMPFRSLLNRFDSIRMLPIDISFLCTFIVLEMLLYMLYLF